MEGRPKCFVAADSSNIKFKEIALTVLKQYESLYEAVILEDNECKYEYNSKDLNNSNLIANLHNRLTSNNNSLAIVLIDEYMGFVIEANKNYDLRCSNCLTTFEASATRNHNHSNVLVVSQETIGEDILKGIISAYLTTQCNTEPRHVLRVKKLGDPAQSI